MPQALAGRLARLIEHHADAEEARAAAAAAAAAPVLEPASATRERAQADLARLRGLLLELGRLAEVAGALTAVRALCVTLRRTAADAQEWVAGIKPELPGLLVPGEF